jgi:exonuclease SbcD
VRLLHTSDWHLGRALHNASLIEDQRHVLDQLIGMVEEYRPDAVLVSGDVYDRSVPPLQAVELLDEVLSRIVIRLRTRVVLIAGNHDSAERLQFGSRLMDAAGLHVAGAVSREVVRVDVSDAHGPLCLYAVPFAEPVRVNEAFGPPDVRSHEEAMARILDAIRRDHPPGHRAVLLAHTFVAGGKSSESERPLTVGDIERVPAACFAGFDYVALGHLHRPQQVGSPSVRYSGSIMKYSFSEESDVKSANLVELDGSGGCSVEPLRLHARRDLRTVTARFQELVDQPLPAPDRGDYLRVDLLDEVPVRDAFHRLRDMYPNLLDLDYKLAREALERRSPSAPRRELDETEMFRAFFEQATGQPPGADDEAVFREVLDAIRRDDREGAGA